MLQMNFSMVHEVLGILIIVFIPSNPGRPEIKLPQRTTNKQTNTHTIKQTHKTVISYLFSYPAILDDLVSSGRLSGSVSGGRQDKTVYVPTIYTEAQNQWVDNFFAQNGYLGKWTEYDNS